MKAIKFLISIFLAITSLVLCKTVDAQPYTDKVLDPSIKTVLFHRVGWELTPPIMQFNSDEKLLLSFDDLNGGYESWQYTLVHCNADWTPTDLWQNEYLQGFTDDYIRDYKSSFNTLQPYTHYWIEIPNRNISFSLPGNYIIKIYANGDVENPVIVRRFMVVDTRITVKGSIKQATDINERFTSQEVAFSIFNPNYPIIEPYRELKVVVLQNYRWDNAKKDIKPLMLRQGEIDYQYTDGTLTFEAGNEFRYFDTKSLRYNSEKIYSIEMRNSQYFVNLVHDIPRAFKPYISEQDLNGNYLIKTDDGKDSSTEGEYAWINFFFPYEVPFPGGEMHVVGEFNKWNPDEKSSVESGQMKFNYARQGYEARLLLKQGYYNYMYAFVDNKSGEIDLSQIEGNHHETGNLYTILVYNREQGSRFDRLIAAETLEK